MREEIKKIVDAKARLEKIEEEYKTDKEAAKEEIKKATRALADIQSESERVEVVLWVKDNIGAPQNDLAWVIFRKENQAYHLRKLAAGPYRECDRCGEKALVGYEFESHRFYCEPCRSALCVEDERRWNESERKAEAKRTKRLKRIAELKAQANLNDTDAKELAALMVSGADGPVSRLAHFIFDGINRH